MPRKTPSFNNRGHMWQGDPRDLFQGTTYGLFPTVLPQRLMLFANADEYNGPFTELEHGQLLQRTEPSWMYFNFNNQFFTQVARDPAEGYWNVLRQCNRTSHSVRWRVYYHDTRYWPTPQYWWSSFSYPYYYNERLDWTEAYAVNAYCTHPALGPDEGVWNLYMAYVPYDGLDPNAGAAAYWSQREKPLYYVGWG